MKPEGLIQQAWLLQAEVSDRFPDTFAQTHGAYLDSLQTSIDGVFSVSSSGEHLDVLQEIGLDWMTLHYQSIHPIQEWEKTTATPWLQASIPLIKALVPYKESLTVYEGSQSPFIESFNESLITKAEPLRILLNQGNVERDRKAGCDEEGDAGRWLAISGDLCEYFVEITYGKRAQNALTADEILRCIETDGDSVTRAKDTFRRWRREPTDLDDGTALGLLRDVCRVSFLGLKQEVFKLPRFVVLAPVYIGGNLIGGIAFVGAVGRTDSGSLALPDHLTTLLLASLAVNVLVALRLREEKEGQAQEKQAAKITALNAAREEAVQRITHELQHPIDNLEFRAKKASELYLEAAAEIKLVQGEAEKLRKASQKLMVAFTENEIGKVLEPKITTFPLLDFLKTQVFLNKSLFAEKGIELRLDFTEDKSVRFDRDMLFEVVDNLLKNAYRYAASLVQLSVEEGDEFVTLIVEDDGEGIAEEVLPRLFQAGVSDRKEEGVHGFGLYRSRELMQRLRGRLKLAPTQQGARFLVQIPKGRILVGDDQDDQNDGH